MDSSESQPSVLSQTAENIPPVFSNTAVLPLLPSLRHQWANAAVYAKHIMEAKMSWSPIPAAETPWCWQNGDAFLSSKFYNNTSGETLAKFGQNIISLHSY